MSSIFIETDSGSGLYESFISKRTMGRRRAARLALTFSSVTSLVLSVGTITLFMWYVHATAYSRTTLSRLEADVRDLKAKANVTYGGSAESMKTAALMQGPQFPVDDRGGTTIPVEAASTIKATTTAAATTSTEALPVGEECRTAGRVPCPDNYNAACFVTNWITKDKKSCRDDGKVEVLRDGHYYVYSHAELSGLMMNGIIRNVVPSENERTSRTLLVKHGILKNENGRYSRMKEVASTGLDHLTSFVSTQVRLRKGNYLHANMTSLNFPNGTSSYWDTVTLGWVFLF